MPHTRVWCGVAVSAPSPTPAQRPARQRLSAEQRREALVDATIEVVAHQGYQRASLTEIARTAGVSKGLLWHYYADGEELMTHAARTALVRVREAVAAELDLTAAVPVVVRAAIRRAALLLRTHAQEMAAIHAIATGLRAPDGSPAISPQEYEQTYALQEELFRRGQREGSLRTTDPRLTAVFYQGAIDAMIAHLRAHPEVDPTACADAVADLVLDGITTRPS
ncbi:TetR family transcriptional regulator [Quadrisphaera setariae]|uniref:TetR family transcriptional regulator n=1 Tax=Quadrisphaera setariae TaxID=2593304 RepID=A0A5C8ZJD2_9ACTN|nr:TetR family transcriptional regulator [Quadrisphaera setariae]